MKAIFHCMGFSRRESLLGLTAVALVVTTALPLLKADLNQEQHQRAGLQAEALAQAVLDYRHDTGRWPHDHEGRLDLAELVQPQPRHDRETALVGSLVAERAAAADPEAGLPWLRELPLDPWNRPYQVFLVDAVGDPEAVGRPGIVAISSGPDGALQTSSDQLNRLCRGGKLPAGLVLCCDDVGYLLPLAEEGGSL
jgi:type II secretory pathway pseudopilin PulG